MSELNSTTIGEVVQRATLILSGTTDASGTVILHKADETIRVPLRDLTADTITDIAPDDYPYPRTASAAIAELQKLIRHREGQTVGEYLGRLRSDPDYDFVGAGVPGPEMRSWIGSRVDEMTGPSDQESDLDAITNHLVFYMPLGVARDLLREAVANAVRYEVKGDVLPVEL